MHGSYLQLCEGGPVTDLVRGLQQENRRMREEHIAYILRETVKVGTPYNPLITNELHGAESFLTS